MQPELAQRAAEAGDAIGELQVAAAALPEDDRALIVLREIEGLSYEEIASVMNCPIGTVRSRIFRAREAVAAQLKPLLNQQRGGRPW